MNGNALEQKKLVDKGVYSSDTFRRTAGIKDGRAGRAQNSDDEVYMAGYELGRDLAARINGGSKDG